MVTGYEEAGKVSPGLSDPAGTWLSDFWPLLLLPPLASGNYDLLSVSVDLFLPDISHKPNDKIRGLVTLAL